MTVKRKKKVTKKLFVEKLKELNLSPFRRRYYMENFYDKVSHGSWRLDEILSIIKHNVEYEDIDNKVKLPKGEEGTILWCALRFAGHDPDIMYAEGVRPADIEHARGLVSLLNSRGFKIVPMTALEMSIHAHAMLEKYFQSNSVSDRP